MVFERDRPRPMGDLEQLNRPAVRMMTFIAVAVVAFQVVYGVVTGDSADWKPLPAIAMAVVGITQMWLKRENAAILLRFCAVAMFATIVVNDEATATSAVALVIIGLGIALFTSTPRLELAGYSAGLLLALSLTSSDNLGDSLPEAAVITALFVFGGSMIYWVRRQLELAATRHEHLFRHAPVSIWMEDFTAVKLELDELEDRGICDLRSYLEGSQDEIARLAQLIEITEVNEAAAALVGATDRMTLFGRLDPVTFTEASLGSLIPQLLAVWDGRDHVVSEVRQGRTLQGERLEGLLSWTVPRIDGRLDLSQTVVAIVDVTDSRIANEQLKALVESKDELIAAVSHELRTPLTTVVGLSTELRDSFDDFDSDELREFVALVAGQSIDLATIVEDLLAAALAEAGSLHIELQPVDAAAEVATTLKSLGLYDAIPIDFVAGLGPISADPGRLRQIVRNLIVNAQRYGDDPIRVVMRGTRDTMLLEVRDAGPELPAAQQDAIFNRYHRASRRPGVAASVGVGLTVSRELARVMGGDVTYAHDGETVFSLSLPSATAPVVSNIGSGLTDNSRLAG